MRRDSKQRRKDLATAVTGGVLLGSGGKARDTANQRAVAAGAKAHPVIPPVVRRGVAGKHRGLYAAGSTLALIGAPAFGVGTYNLAKREKHFLREGVEGTVQALQQQTAERTDERVPLRIRAAQAAGATGAAIGGGAAAGHYFKHAPKIRGAAVPIAGALTATATVPVTNRAARRRGYEITPTGARRVKETPKRPSSKASTFRPAPRSLSADIGKRDTTNYGAQRAAVTGAAGVPVAGPVLAAMASRRFAPPGQENKHTARQLAVPAAGLAAGAGGAYGGAALAGRSRAVERGAQRTFDWAGRKETQLRGGLGMKTGQTTVGRALGRINSSKLKAVAPLKGPGRIAGAVVGGLGAKAATNFGGGQAAISLNQRDSKRWRAGVSKQAPPRLSDRQKHKEARQKRRNAAVTQLAAVGSLGAAGLLAMGNPTRSLQVGTASGAIGASNALYGAHLQRRDAQRADPYSKNPVVKRAAWQDRNDRTEKTSALMQRAQREKADRLARGKETDRWEREDSMSARSKRKHQDFDRWLATEVGLRRRNQPKVTAKPLWSNPALKRLAQQDREQREAYFQSKRGRQWMRRNGLGRAGALSWGPTQPTDAWRKSQGFGLERKQPSTGYRGSGRPYGVHKADNGKDHQDLIRRYGDRGPLPKGLDRDTKIRAYEARYAAHGGHKGEKWQRRANVAEGTRNAGLAGATLAGAAYVGARTPLGRRLAPKTQAKLRGRADLAAVGSATVGGAAELYGEYARGRRASYASAPGGVAASALTRLRANTPKEQS